MGYAISWLAIRGKEPDQVLQDLGLQATGEMEETPRSPLTGVTLPSGWFVVYANEFNSPQVSETSLATLSVGCRVVACQVEEHAMASAASYYSNGKRQWRVEHDAQKSIYHLNTQGNLPEVFQDIHASMMKAQGDAGGEAADVDYIHDIPLAVAQALTAFRHDDDVESLDPEPFQVLVDPRRTAPVSKPWWRFWQ